MELSTKINKIIIIMVDFFSGIKVNYVSHYDDNVVPKAVHARADPNVSAHISVL